MKKEPLSIYHRRIQFKVNVQKMTENLTVESRKRVIELILN